MRDAAHRRELGAALAAAFLAGAWTEEAMVRRAADALEPRPRWLRRLVRDTLAAPTPARRPTGRASSPRTSCSCSSGSVRRRPAADPALARLRARHGTGRRWPVPPIASPGELAERLELDAAQLAWLADVRGLERSAPDRRLRHYSYLWLPRPGAPPRPIARPKRRLKEIQRWILHAILDRIPAHDAAHGFVRGRSARTHAAQHIGRGTVVRIDLEDFFASVSAARVYGDLPHRRLSRAGRAHADRALRHVVPRAEWDARAAPRATRA